MMIYTHKQLFAELEQQYGNLKDIPKSTVIDSIIQKGRETHLTKNWKYFSICVAMKEYYNIIK